MAHVDRKGSEYKKKEVIHAKGKSPKKYPRLAIVDHLSGLYNRRFFDETLQKFISTSKKNKKHFSLLMSDIDNFKNVNDKYGHLAGDRILKGLGKILKESVRRIDMCFRYGGDEITILLPNAEKKAAEDIVERLKMKVEKYEFSINKHNKIQLQLSVGIAVFPKDGQTPEALIKKADELLYKNKYRKERKREKFSELFILKTKLTQPALKETIISRPRLISLLKENLDKKLIYVLADAGYGKTTLLTQLVHDQNLNSVFYNLDKGDSDLMLFLSYLIEGLSQIQPELAKLSSNLLKQGTGVTTNYELIIGTLINELNEQLDRELYFVLDDYHTIFKDSLVHKALDYFIDHMPSKVHVIISSRSESSLFSLAKLQSKQHLFELSREDLKFTSEEIKILLSRVYRILLTGEELKRVSDHTEGWITGIQLILQTAGKDRKTVKETLNGYIAANQPLFDYFANEILTAESVRVQNFLKHSSVLETMTPDACNTVLRIKDSIKLLRDLQHRNLFVSAIGKDEYKYHNMFRQFLQDRISDAQVRRSLHLKAAQYYKQKGQIEQAIEHYLHVGNYTQAGKLIVQIESQMRIHARFTTLNTWLKQMPKNIFQKRPQLLITLGRLYWVQGDLKQAEQIFIQAEELLKNESSMLALAKVLHAHGSLLLSIGSDHEVTLETFRKALQACADSAIKLRGEILISIGTLYRVLCDFKKARIYWLKAYRIAEQINDFHKRLSIENNLAMLLLTQGELQAGFGLFKQLIEHIGDDYWVEVGIIFANAAGAALTYGKLAWAEECLDKGWSLCRAYEDPFSKIGLHEGFALLYMYKEQWNLAEQHFYRAMDGCKKLQWTIVEFYLFGFMSRFYRYRGDFTKAKKYLELMWKRLHKKQSIQEVSCLVETSFLHIALEEFEKAEKSIRKSMRLTQKFGLNRHKFFSYLVLASVYLAKHKDYEASRFLRRAIRLAKVKGFTGLLARELRHNQHLLRHVQKNTIEKSYISSLNLSLEMPKVHIRVQCFGGLELQDKKGRMIPLVWTTEKACSLFAFLVVHRKTQLRRDTLMVQLWPNYTKKRAIQNFRTTASRMRQSLAKALSGKLPQDEIFVWEYGKYRLLPDVDIQLDIEECDLLLKEAERVGSDTEKAQIIKQALDIYRGDFLPEIYDPWTDVIRLRLRERRLSALRWIADYFAKQGDNLGCVTACETYLSVDPLSEEVVRLCMRNLNRLGQVATIKARYKSLKHDLRRELDCTPSRETEDLYLSIIKSHSN
jgi:LuxR family maltose regulon positive regulatory protein